MPKRPLSAKSRRTAGTLGDYVSTFRRLQGLTAEQVADRAGVTRNTLRKLEQGDASVGLDVFLEVCRVLGILDFVVEGMNPYDNEVENPKNSADLQEHVQPDAGVSLLELA